MGLGVQTRKRVEMVDVTREVAEACRRWGKTGLVHLYCPHTTAGVVINESCDPDVAADILRWMAARVPSGDGYAHAEGNADAHVRSVLTGCHVTLPVRVGEPLLGRWQGVFFCEFDGPRARALTLTFVEGAEGP